MELLIIILSIGILILTLIVSGFLIVELLTSIKRYQYNKTIDTYKLQQMRREYESTPQEEPEKDEHVYCPCTWETIPPGRHKAPETEKEAEKEYYSIYLN